MNLEAFSIKWFTIYYPVFGLIITSAGFWLVAKPRKMATYLTTQTGDEQPPSLLRNILRYWLLFTLPCLFLSFFPFSWTELLFSVWSLLMVYVAGAQLVRWNKLRHVILENPAAVITFSRIMGATMMSAGVVIVLLAYLKILAL
ncbi:MAG: hypothetical protein R3281_08695 [Balneolaceae bacterium]|nr:hypothetical protein [Balneolaceae bacterium]